MEAVQKEQQNRKPEATPAKKKPIIRWQKPNVGVMYALIPAILASIYYFGWRSLMLLAAVCIAGFLTEYLFLKAYYKEPVSSAVFVSCFLFTLSLPPTLPVWIAVVGIVFGIALGKMAFGGFGRNIFNPALTGRAFIYISFGGPMTAAWVEHIGGGAGGFLQFAADTVTRATPMARILQGLEVSRLSMFLGNEAGCLGETSALLLLIGGIYIVWKKHASWRIVASTFIGMLIPQTVFWLAGLGKAIDPLSAVLGGGFMLGAWFMTTDPVSASQTTNTGRWIYGAFIGAVTVLIRSFSIWSGGIMFAILLGNMFAAIIDYYVKQSKSKDTGK
jgi:Na+-transporting NADH:ubiquinone oxidoreductase subunit B